MKTFTIFALLTLSIIPNYFSQEYYQYFDGADTSVNNSLIIQMDQDTANIWQVGPPQKNIFDTAATYPNVIITDTINPYPPNNNSSFQFTIVPPMTWGILALQWKQKLDLEHLSDGGKVEFSADGGITWENAFNNPNVYNFYGFDSSNVELTEGYFTGTDTNWRDIWLCYEMSWMNLNDSIIVRYTLFSDTLNTGHEGWMMDNFITHLTWIHTVQEIGQDAYIRVFPNPTSDILYIETKKLKEYHIIEEMQLMNAQGQILESWKNIPTKYFINTKNYPDGNYFIKIHTNLKTETLPIEIIH